MKKITFLMLLVFCCISSNLFGQNANQLNSDKTEFTRCSFQEKHDYLMVTDAEYAQNVFITRKNRAKRVEQHVQGKMPACPAGEVTIPVVVHFDFAVPAGDQACLIALAQEQIDILNADYSGNNASGCSTGDGGTSDACMTFVLANQNHPAVSGLADGTPAVTFNQFSCGGGGVCIVNDWQGYFNIMVTTGTGLLGYSPLNGSTGATNNNNAIVIEACAFGALNPAGFPGGCSSAGPQSGCGAGWQYTGGATVTHEAGHWFGLEHTFCTDNGNGTAGANGCNDCDGYTDTPPQGGSQYGCGSGTSSGGCATPVNVCGGTYTYGNFMDYLDDACMDSFSDEQSTDMNQNAAVDNFINVNTVFAACDGITIDSETSVCDADGVNHTVTVTYTIAAGATNSDYTLTTSNVNAVLASGSATSSGAGTYTVTYSVPSGEAVVVTITADADAGCFEETGTLSAFCGSTECPAYSAAAVDITEACEGDDITMTIPQNCQVTPAQIEVVINFDSFASETSWELANAAGTVVASGGPYANGDAGINIPVTVDPNDTYTFTITDSYGDGMNGAACGFGGVDGTYSLVDVISGATLSGPDAFEGNASCDGGAVTEVVTGLVGTGPSVSTETVELLINGAVVNTFPNDAPCADETLTFSLTTDNMCAPEAQTIGYNIICEDTGLSIAAETFNINVYPAPPTNATDMATVTIDNGTCAATVTPANDCVENTHFTVTETSAPVAGSSSTAEGADASYSITYTGENASACCVDITELAETPGTPTAITLDGTNTNAGGTGNGSCVAGAGAIDFIDMDLGLTGDQLGIVCFDLTVVNNQGTVVNFGNADFSTAFQLYLGSLFTGGTNGDGGTAIDFCIDLTGAFTAADGPIYTLNVQDAGCLVDGTNNPTGVVNEVTTGIINVIGNTCDFTLDVPYNCEVTANCTLTGAGLVDGVCDNAGTTTNPADDTFTFDLNPVGSTLGTAYTITGVTGVSPAGGNYGAATTFTASIAANGGAGTVTVTITDGTDAACTFDVTVTIPADCSTECANITNAGTSGAFCSGDDFSITGFAATTTVDQDSFILVYDVDVTTIPTDSEIYDFLTGGPTNPGDIQQFGELVDGAGLSNGSVDLSAIAGYTTTGCTVFELDVYFVPLDAQNSLINVDCPISDAVRVTFYPDFQVTTSGDNACNPFVALEVTDEAGAVVNTCSTLGDATQNCTGDVVYDFSTFDISDAQDGSLTLATAAACVTGTTSGTLTCNPIAENDETINICQSDLPYTINAPAGYGSYLWGDASTNPTFVTSIGGLFTVTITNADGCELALSYDIIVSQPTIGPDVTNNGCIGDGFSVVVGVNTYNEANPTGTEVLTNAAGCDSTVNVVLTFAATSTGSASGAACTGATTNIGGTDYAPGVYNETLVNAAGCDSLVTITVTEILATSSTYNDSFCQGGSATINGQVFNAAGNFVQVIPNAAGCDSTITVVITELLPTTGTAAGAACTGSTANVGGTDYAPGTYTETLVNGAGCDSIVTITVTELLPTTGTAAGAACTGSTANVGGTDYAPGTYTETLVNGAGCDSIITITVTELLPTTGTATGAACTGSTTNVGGTDYAPGVYNEVLVNAAGCDSTVTITVTELLLTAGTYDETVCTGGTATVNGNAYTVGSYTETLTNAAGCDSTLTVTITEFTPTADISEIATYCQESGASFTSPSGTVYDEATPTGNEIVQDANGCDYNVTVALTFEDCTDPCENVVDETVSYTGCSGDGYSEIVNGVTYDEANPTGVENVVDGNGCAYMITVNLTFNALTADVDTDLGSVCEGGSVDYNGVTYDATNTPATLTLQDANGCDYSENITLSFFPVTEDVDTDLGSVCEGGSVDYNGITYDVTNTPATLTLQDANGCDYSENITLAFFTTTPDVSESYVGCEGDGYNVVVNSVDYNEANPTGSETIQDANGCDYIVTIDLTFEVCTDPCASVTDQEITYVGCTGDGYSEEVNGTTYNEANPTGTENITDGNGCSYVATVTFTFNALTADINETATYCQGSGESYTSPSGTVYDETNPTGTETIADANNCNYSVTVTLTFEDCTDPCATVTDQEVTYTGCAGDGYNEEVNGITYDETNPTGTETITDANDCTYTVTVNFVFNALTENVLEEATYCQGSGESYTSPSGTVYDEANPMGTETITDANSCDYTVTVALTFEDCTDPCATVVDQEVNYTGCLGDGYSEEVNGTTYNEANPTGTENVTDGNGCTYDIVVTLVFNDCTDPCDSVVDINTDLGTVCTGESVEYNGFVYDASNTPATVEQTDANNCTYNESITLSFYAVTDDVTTDLGNVCENGTIDYNGITYSATNTPATITLTDANGCEYTETITLNELSGSENVTTFLEACAGETVDYNGETLTEANPTATIEQTDVNGCTFTEVVSVSFFDLTANELVEAEYCSGSGFTYTSVSGTIYDEANSSGMEVLTDDNGCSYELTVSLTFIDCTDPCELTEDINVTGTYCLVEEYSYTSPSGTVYDSTNTSGSESLQDGNGCDYTITIDLTFEDCVQVGSISSVVFYDENANGVQDGGEFGISGAEVFIVYPDGTIDVTITDINGEFTFDDLEAGEYEIFVGAVPGFEATTANTFTIELGDGEDYKDGSTIFGFDLPEQNTIDCENFLVDYTAECNDDKTTFTVTVTVTGFDPAEGYMVSSTNPIIDGTVYTTETFVDGPYGTGIGFNYQISPVSDPSCIQTISVSSFACTVTAVELVEFTGRTLDNTNELSWTTVSEIENDYFTLERSYDGSTFEAIGNINGHGTTSTVHTYSFNDSDVQNGVTYYRLKSVDFNGSIDAASDVISLRRDENVSVSVFPIPASDVINIDLSGVIDASVASIYDVSGKIVKEVNINSNETNYSLNISDLATGAYFIQITTSDNILTTRFIKK